MNVTVWIQPTGAPRASELTGWISGSYAGRNAPWTPNETTNSAGPTTPHQEQACEQRVGMSTEVLDHEAGEFGRPVLGIQVRPADEDLELVRSAASSPRCRRRPAGREPDPGRSTRTGPGSERGVSAGESRRRSARYQFKAAVAASRLAISRTVSSECGARLGDHHRPQAGRIARANRNSGIRGSRKPACTTTAAPGFHETPPAWPVGAAWRPPIPSAPDPGGGRRDTRRSRRPSRGRARGTGRPQPHRPGPARHRPTGRSGRRRFLVAGRPESSRAGRRQHAEAGVGENGVTAAHDVAVCGKPCRAMITSPSSGP